jgi:ubiquinone/menaquinone biosynthesis methyltransferase
MKKFRLKDYDLQNSGLKKEYNEKLFDIVAPKYDVVTRILSFGRDGSWKKKLVNFLPETGDPECLDLACGTGDIISLLLKRFKIPRITGLDLNDVMLELSGKRFSNFKEKVTLEKGDMSDMKMNDGLFDLITGSYALRNAPDIVKTLREIYRVCKPGGTCVFLDFSKSGNKIVDSVQFFFLKLWGQIWGFLLHGNPEIYGYIADSLKLFPDRKSLKKMIGETGFGRINSRILFFGFIEIVSFQK